MSGNFVGLEKKFFLPMLLVFFIGAILINIYPIYQFFTYGNFYFYQNAYDEYSYLSNSFAKYVAEGHGRISSNFIVYLHEIGISGAMINIVFDWSSIILIYIGIFYLIQRIFINSSINKIHLTSFVIIFSPLLFNNANPIISKLNTLFFENHSIVYFMTFAESIYLPIQRTPEPQMSILMLLLITYLSVVKGGLYRLSLLAIPMLYPFIAVPAFMLVIMFAVKKFFLERKKLWQQLLVSSLISYIVISTALYFYYNFLILDKLILTNTHIPLFGLSLVWILLTILMCKYLFPTAKLSNNDLFFIGSLIISSILIINTQIIAGYIAQPNNFEQYFSIYIPSMIFTVYYLKSNQELSNILKTALLIVLFCAIAGHLKYVYKTNEPIVKQFDTLIKNTELKNILKNSTVKVSTGNYLLDSYITGFYNPKATLILNYTNSYYGYFKQSYYCDYVDFKNKFGQLNIEDINKSKFVIDKAYKYLNLDHVLLHLYRRDNKEFQFKCDKNVTNNILFIY